MPKQSNANHEQDRDPGFPSPSGPALATALQGGSHIAPSLETRQDLWKGHPALASEQGSQVLNQICLHALCPLHPPPRTQRLGLPMGKPFTADEACVSFHHPFGMTKKTTFLGVIWVFREPKQPAGGHTEVSSRPGWAPAAAATQLLPLTAAQRAGVRALQSCPPGTDHKMMAEVPRQM